MSSVPCPVGCTYEVACSIMYDNRAFHRSISRYLHTSGLIRLLPCQYFVILSLLFFTCSSEFLSVLCACPYFYFLTPVLFNVSILLLNYTKNYLHMFLFDKRVFYSKKLLRSTYHLDNMLFSSNSRIYQHIVRV